MLIFNNVYEKHMIKSVTPGVVLYIWPSLQKIYKLTQEIQQIDNKKNLKKKKKNHISK